MMTLADLRARPIDMFRSELLAEVVARDISYTPTPGGVEYTQEDWGRDISPAHSDQGVR